MEKRNNRATNRMVAERWGSLACSLLGGLAILLYLGDKATNNVLLTGAGILGLGAAMWNLITLRPRHRLLLASWALLFAVLTCCSSPAWRPSPRSWAQMFLVGITTGALFSVGAGVNRLIADIPDRLTATAVRVCAATLLAFLGWTCFCSVISPQAETAMRLLVKEQLVYGTWFFALPLAAMLWRKQAVSAGLAACYIVLGAVVAMLVVAGLYVGGLLPQHLSSLDGWIRINPVDSSDGWRLQFPFWHHNRAGFFGMCAAFIAPAFFVAKPNPQDWLAILSGVMGLIVALLSGTRGAVLACLIGWGGASLSLVSTRNRLSFVLGALTATILAGVLLASSPHRSHWEELFLFRPPLLAQTSTSTRLIIQSVALNLIAARPLTGWGYGYLTFENLARQFYPQLARQIEGMSHPHNHWFEIAVAGGVPAAILFFLFTLARLVALAEALRESALAGTERSWRFFLAIWLGLELAIQFYGLTNTCLRRNLGLWTYTLWAISLVLVYETPKRCSSGYITPSPRPESGR